MRNLWTDTCAETVPTAVLSGDRTVDIAIIGGGFTGCSAALEGARNGAQVAVFEAQTIGYGGSGRNVGLVNAGLWLPPDEVIAQMGQEAGTRLNTVLADGPAQVFDLIQRHDIQCEATRTGTLHLAHAPKAHPDLQNRYDQQVARGAPVTLIDMKKAAQLTGSKGFSMALKDDRAGTVQPLGYAKGLARAAAEEGALIYENCPVTAVQQDTDWRVITPNGSVRAKYLLMATNAYHHDFNGLQSTPLTPVHFFQLATTPMSDRLNADILPEAQGCWDTGLVMSSFRKDTTGRFILGAMGRPDRLGIHRAWASRALSRLFPQLAGQEFAYFWSGRIGMTSDHIPKIQTLGRNAFAVFGYSGRGISPGTIFGTAIARAFLGGNESLPIEPIEEHQERFCDAKGVYFETGARLVHAVTHRI